jgi:CyaY protein
MALVYRPRIGGATARPRSRAPARPTVARAGRVIYKQVDVDQAVYHREVAACLGRIAAALDACEDLDFQTGDGLVAIEFEDGARFVVNRQSGADQMWLAADARAWHYDWDAARETWVDDRDGHRLYDRLAEVVSAKLGRAVSFD